MTEKTTMRISIPPLFAEDHCMRDLPIGVLVEQTKKGWVFDVTQEEFDEWFSDARHYSDCAGPGWDFGRYKQLAMQASARATVVRFMKLKRE